MELLVEKTSMEKTEVEAQLEQLIERIVSATTRGKALEIKGFGTFYFDGDQELKFDPANTLRAEISYKYAGMLPVELIPERDTSITPEEVDPELDEPDSDASYLVPAAGESAQTAEEADEEHVSGAAAESGDFEESVDKPAEPADTGEQDVSDEPQAVPEPKEQVPADPPARNVNRVPPLATMERRRSSGAFIWVLLAIILTAAGLAAYFYFSSQDAAADVRLQDPAMPGGQVVESGSGVNNVESALPEGESVEVSGAIPQEAMAEGNGHLQPDSAPEGLQSQPVYGLMGDIQPDANDGYSIVLHSFDEQAKAEEAGELLENEGYRTIVGSRTVAGRTMWRVSVGQFQTLPEAQAAATELSPPFDTQNFIHRIQLNN